MENLQEIPVELSATSDNAHYHWCKGYQQKRSYYSCLHLVSAIESGRLDELNDDRTSCAYHYKVGACSAAKMKDEEKSAGRALYFEPKRKVEIKQVQADMSSESYALGWNKVGVALGKDEPVKKKLPAKLPKTQPQTISDDNSQDFGKAIELAAKRERLAKLKKLKELQAKKKGA